MWIRHPEPNGSRRATPTSQFQHRAGHPPRSWPSFHEAFAMGPITGHSASSYLRVRRFATYTFLPRVIRLSKTMMYYKKMSSSESETLALMQTYGSRSWKKQLACYLTQHQTLVTSYGRERNLQCIPVCLSPGQSINLSPGVHSKLIKEIIENFAIPKPRHNVPPLGRACLGNRSVGRRCAFASNSFQRCAFSRPV